MIQLNNERKKRSQSIYKNSTIGSLINSIERKHSGNESIISLLNNLRDGVLELGGRLEDDSHRKFISEIIFDEKPSFKSFNLIVSPSGSGKSTFIKEVLIEPERQNDFLWLTIEKEDFSVTYNEFETKLNSNPNFLEKFKYILCDDFNVFLKHKKENNSFVQSLLKPNASQGKQFFYFTTNEEQFLEEYLNDKTEVKIINYTKHNEVRKYVELNRKSIKSLGDLDIFFYETPATTEPSANYKGLAVGDNYDEIMWLDVYTKDNGVRPICLWTKEDSDKKLSAEQAKVLKYIQEQKRIPFEYDLIILTKNALKLLEIDDNKLKYAIISKDHDEDNILKGNRHLINLVVHEDDYHVDEVKDGKKTIGDKRPYGSTLYKKF